MPVSRCLFNTEQACIKNGSVRKLYRLGSMSINPDYCGIALADDFGGYAREVTDNRIKSYLCSETILKPGSEVFGEIR